MEFVFNIILQFVSLIIPVYIMEFSRLYAKI